MAVHHDVVEVMKVDGGAPGGMMGASSGRWPTHLSPGREWRTGRRPGNSWPSGRTIRRSDRIPGVLNYFVGQQAGIDVISKVWAAVPHYLSNQEYPLATEALKTASTAVGHVNIETRLLVVSVHCRRRNRGQYRLRGICHERLNRRCTTTA